ncbi:aspartate--tRNA ligase [Breznakiellaceae bacterium SP9]
MKRSVNCGALRGDDAGKEATLNGWVHRKRDHGGISFINVRDRYGITQVTVDPAELSGTEWTELEAQTALLRNEYCIAVRGIVRRRPDTMVNPAMPTGEIEVLARQIVVLNKSEVLPFPIDEETEAKEELRLKYRYLDLRRKGMQERIRLRSETAFAVREHLTAQGFLEIETPTFIRSTPEGARDYLVPSRLYAGKFYALPQSPQLYKQLIMVGGFDKYFQIARCYRDEDARGDRQPEFTQIDIEMSFAGRDDILELTEGLMGHIFNTVLDYSLPVHFKRLSYHETQERYGTDKPDLRFGLELQDFAPYVEAGSFEAFKIALLDGEANKALAAAKGITIEGGGVKALLAPGLGTYSRKQIEELESHAKRYKAKGMAWMKVNKDGALEGGVSKFFAGNSAPIIAGLGAVPGDLILMVGDSVRKVANTSLGAVRSKLGHDLGLTVPKEGEAGKKFEFVWIVDFPLFEWNEEESHWEAAHHLFSYPQERFHATLESDPGAVLGDLYDLVLNGYELASGSIRIHDSDLQKRIFSIAGITDEAAEKKFGFLTTAFKFGAPPHGGIAPGLDRLVMLMAGESSIKEVIAFPKNSFAQSLMDECPGEIEQKQLDELHLSIRSDQDI